MLVAVMFLLAILVISMSVAGPIIKKQIQHDREIETMHRGQQYVRAIKMYYKKFGAYPPTIDALVNTNQIRFLRKKYTDPTTGKADWKVIHLGQNKVPTAWGFFGQPLSGSTVAGIGPGGLGTNGLNGTNGNSPFGGPPVANSGGVSGTPQTDPSPSTSGPTDPNNPSGTSTGPDGTTGANGTGSGAGTGTGLSGQTGQTFGGAGIIGVSPNSPKQSILTLHKKNHYNEWEFVYDPLAEQMMMQGGNTGLGGNPAGSSNGSPGFNSPTTPATTPTSPTTPTTTSPSQ